MQLSLQTTSALCLAISLGFSAISHAKESINNQLEANQAAPLFLAPMEISLDKLFNTNDLAVQKTPQIKITTLPTLSAEKKKLYENLALPENFEPPLDFQQETTPLQLNSDFTPLCPTLDTNVSYSLSGTFTGDSYCYHFTIPNRAKTTTYIVDQNTETDFTLSLIYDDGDNNLFLLGTSNNPNNNDEFVQAITDPGHYYWLLEANSSTGEPISFGSITSTNFDQYEINDTRDQATIIPDGMHTYLANSDSAIDYDYYSFTAIRGQDLGVYFEGTSNNSNSWILELYNGGQWVALNRNIGVKLENLTPNYRVDIRVRPNPTQLPTPQMFYRLIFGSLPASSDVSLTGESNFIRIPYSAPVPFMTTQTLGELRLNVTARDSKGGAIPGITAILNIYKADPNGGPAIYTPHSVTLGSNGNANTYINLGSCHSSYQVDFQDYSQGYINTWRTNFDYGEWHLNYLGFGNQGGFGSSNTLITMGHICKQQLISSIKN